MITTDEIAVRVRDLLLKSKVKTMISGKIGYERTDYTKEDVIIIPRTITGEGSVREGAINVNIHVPDILLKDKKHVKDAAYVINRGRIIEIRAEVISVLQNHYERGEGYNWTVGLIQPPMREQGHDEHFASITLDLTVRNK